MENSPVTITLTVGQWSAILSVLSAAPFNLVNQINEAINALQSQAGPQVQAAQEANAPVAEADGGEVSE
jgi:hypothetical protein